MTTAKVQNLIWNELRSTSVTLDLPPDETALLLFYDYPPLAERLQDADFFVEDIHTKQIFYRLYQSLPELVDEILNSPGFRALIPLSDSDIAMEVAHRYRIWSSYADLLIFQTSNRQPREITMDVGWADHYHKYEVEGRIVHRKLLASLFSGTPGPPIDFLYLPHLATYFEGVGAGESPDRRHALQVTRALERLNRLPLIVCENFDPPLSTLWASESISLSFIDAESPQSLHTLLSRVTKFTRSIGNLLQQVLLDRSNLDEIIAKLKSEADLLHAAICRLDQEGTLFSLGGKVNNFNVQICAAKSDDGTARLILKTFGHDRFLT